jgi:hypothetical protein
VAALIDWRDTVKPFHPTQWTTLRDWAESGAAKPLFPTLASAEWFIRQHRPELVERGVYVPRGGRAGSLVSSDFQDVALDIFRREAGEGRAA